MAKRRSHASKQQIPGFMVPEAKRHVHTRGNKSNIPVLETTGIYQERKETLTEQKQIQLYILIFLPYYSSVVVSARLVNPLVANAAVDHLTGSCKTHGSNHVGLGTGLMELYVVCVLVRWEHTLVHRT